ncbi:hypothetical protein OJ997_13615 [Solirubrobacter phytolaccae]|uniref:FMN-binding protein n=1 Tax=Solirubrobacter phytolaccae TaxID=1404360 RepID=A0A9X3S8D9_9ACTN|nr:hypothetical protein [Solirubrobacter phytolaccae]MDA0181338.1 hypothetical protein [Solirubrobacter phytolaccae]
MASVRDGRALVALALTGATLATGCGSDAPPGDGAQPTATATATATAQRPRAEAGTTYRDGDYEAKGWYGGLPSNIDVALTLRDNRVTDVEVTANATNATSRDYQERFAEAVPDAVVGKRLDEVRVSRLAGSSGTPDGFNQAIERIKDQAAS